MKNIFRRTVLQSLSNELEEPIRAEIFGVSRFELHAESLAHAQKVTDNPLHHLARSLVDSIITTLLERT